MVSARQLLLCAAGVAAASVVEPAGSASPLDPAASARQREVHSTEAAGREHHTEACDADGDSHKAAAEPAAAATGDEPWDENGYVLGCICQGRFGNQFDYMLSFIDYAKRLNRTAILPPWVEYNAQPETGQYPYYPAFAEFFSVGAIRRHHRAIDADVFMERHGAKWRALGMVGYSALGERDKFEKGVPRAGFWKRLGVEFDRFERVSPGARSGSVDDISHPVLAMDCVPGKYPAPAPLNSLARYFEWSDGIEQAASRLVESQIGRGQAYVAVQWRQEFAGMATPTVTSKRPARCAGFSVSQCAPYVEDSSEPAAAAATGARRTATIKYPTELCAPSLESMRQLLREALAAVGPGAKLYVASDVSFQKLGELGELFVEMGAVTQEGGAMNFLCAS